MSFPRRRESRIIQINEIKEIRKFEEIVNFIISISFIVSSHEICFDFDPGFPPSRE